MSVSGHYGQNNKFVNCLSLYICSRPDEFEIEGKDIGILTQVKLKRDDGNGDDDWYVEWVSRRL